MPLEHDDLLTGILSFQRELNRCVSADETARIILQTALTLCRMEGGSFYLSKPEGYLCAADRGNPLPNLPADSPLPADHPLLQTLFSTDRPGKLHNLTASPGGDNGNSAFCSTFAILLRSARGVIALLILGSRREDAMEEKDRTTLAMLVREAETVLGRIHAEEERQLLYRELEDRVIERTGELQNRIKELHGLHGFTSLCEQPNAKLPEILNKLPLLLRDSMQRSDIANVRIELDEQIYETPGFHPTPWMIEAPILVLEKKRGEMFLAYGEKRFPDERPAFAEGETALLRTTAQRLGRMLERQHVTHALEKSEQQYRDLFARLSIPALLCDPATLRITNANLAAEKLFQLESPLLVLQTLFDLCPKNTFQKNAPFFDPSAASAAPEPCRREVRLTNRLGHIMDVIFEISPTTIDGETFLFILIRDVTEHKRALFQKEILNRISTVFALSDDLDKTLLQVARDLAAAVPDTDAAISLYDPERQRITVQGSNKYIVIPPKDCFDNHLTFSGIVTASGQPFWCADIQQHEEYRKRILYRLGARSVLSIPIKAPNQALGAIILYTLNKTDDLQALVSILYPIASTLAGEILRKRAEQHIRRHDAILEAINYAAQQFINRPFNQTDINKVLAILGYAANVDRVYIFENHFNEERELCMSQRFEWCSQGTSPQIDNTDLQNAPYSRSAPRWAEILSREEIIYGNTEDLPEQEQASLAPQGILSLAVVPIFSATTWWGFIGFDDCKRQRTWQAMELEALKTAADVIGASVLRQKNEEALRHSEEQLRAMYEKNMDIILILDPVTGKILRVNESAFRLLGYEPEQLIGETLEFLLPTNARRQIPDIREFTSDKNVCLTQKFVRFDGGLCSMDFRATAIPWENGSAVFVTLRDVTDREYAEEILKRNEERFRRIFEETPVSLWERDYSRVIHYLATLRQRGVTDFERHFNETPADLRWCLHLINVLDVNNISLSMFKARDKEELVKRYAEIYGSDLTNNLAAEIVALATQSRNLNIECVHHTLDGRDLNLIMRWSVIPGYENSYRRVLVSYVDITPQRTAEREAKLRREQLIQADKMIALGTLVAGVAHEINNPNSFVTLNAPLLAEIWEHTKPILDDYSKQHGDFDLGIGTYSEMRDEVEVLLNDIIEGARRIRTIVKDLKNFARQNPSEAFDMIALNDSVHAVCALLRNAISKATTNVEITCAQDIPPIRANKQRLEQVLMNLIINACQALPDRSHGIRIATGVDAARREAFIRIEDEGCGIPAEHLTRIMDPFYTTKRDSGGTGLGLSISSTIMEEHGGRLEFQSEINKGTAATMILPLPSDQPNAAQPPTPFKTP